MTPATGAPSRSRGAAAEPWTVLKLMLWSADYLASKGVESARLDAEHLLAHVLGVGRLEMYLQHERPLEPHELDGFRPLLKRRASREPLQYILRRQPFREIELEVGPAALIPRPETEVLVGIVLDWASGTAAGSTATALDLGTGTGAIGISLLEEGPFERVVATDVSPAALDLARRNADAAGHGEGLDLREGDLFQPVGPDENFDVVASNPPYIAEPERGDLAPEVRDWEPGEALFAGHDGLDVLRRIVSGAGAVLRPGGLLAVEVGSGQGGAVQELVADAGSYEEPRLHRDLAGKPRVITAERRLD